MTITDKQLAAIEKRAKKAWRGLYDRRDVSNVDLALGRAALEELPNVCRELRELRAKLRELCASHVCETNMEIELLENVETLLGDESEGG